MPPGKFGVEAEYALVRTNGEFCDYTNMRYEELARLLEPLPDFGYPELRSGSLGIKVKNWYAEGDERFDNSGRLIDFAVKGVEIRTPAKATLTEAFDSLRELRAMLREVIEPVGFRLAAIGFNPITESYAPTYSDWERAYHRDRPEYILSEISTLSYGPDLNFSFSEWGADRVLATARRLTYYSPYIVPFSLNAPFHGGTLWGGLSYRTYHRTGDRPAALAHIRDQKGEPLVRAPKVPAQHGRIEFKALDMIDDDALLEELFYLIVGIALASEEAVPGKADRPDKALHQAAALDGFDHADIFTTAQTLVAVARDTLLALGQPHAFPRLGETLASRRVPAHALRDSFEHSGALLSTFT